MRKRNSTRSSAPAVSSAVAGTRSLRRKLVTLSSTATRSARSAAARAASADVAAGLRGPYKWNCFYFYVILDVFSRYAAVGWAVAATGTACLAQDLIAENCAVEGITWGQLTIHADRGTSITSKMVALLLADLGITRNARGRSDNPCDTSSLQGVVSETAIEPRHGD